MIKIPPLYGKSMAKDFGIMAGVAGGVGLALTLRVALGAGDVIWSYLPIGNDGETLQEWASRTTGVA